MTGGGAIMRLSSRRGALAGRRRSSSSSTSRRAVAASAAIAAATSLRLGHRRRPLPLAASAAASSQASPTASAATATDDDGLILPLGEPGAWDSGAVGNPVVRYYVSPPPPAPRGASAEEVAAAARAPPSARWVMWYSGRPSGAPAPPLALAAALPGSGATGVAFSEDGVQWRRGAGDVAGSQGAEGRSDAGRALAPNADEWWWHDTCHATVSDVQVLGGGGGGGGGGVYWMFYTGGDFEAVEAPGALSALHPSSPSASVDGAVPATDGGTEGLRMRVGLAMSQDGRNFARIEGDHHTGAMLDGGGGASAVAGGGDKDAATSAPHWDSLFVSSPSVLVSGPSGDMRMYYTSFDASRGRFAVGLATSKDGLKWQRFASAKGGGGNGGAAPPSSARAPIFEGTGQAWDACGAASVQVVRDPDDPRGRFLMFYEAVAADGARSIGAAASADGVSGWEPLACCGGGAPLLGPSDAGAWDGGGVGAPCAVPMSGGRWRLYYAGRPASAAAGGGDDDGAWRGVGLALGDLSGGEPFRRRAA